jgi:choline dehydrogenase-like flavoprotein
MCPRTQCKGDTTRFCLRPALERHGAKLLTECEVSRIEASAEAVRFVHATWKDRELRIPARTVVLAAGGFMTPAILLRSQSEDWPDGLANSSGLVGRNLMLHSGDFIAIRPPKQVAFSGPMKAISLNDFYVRKGKKLGTLQSVGVTASPGLVLGYLRGQVEKDPTWWLKLARPFFRPVAHAAAFFFRHAGMLATIVEDLPYYDNRVVVDLEDRNGMRFEYTYSEDLRQRNRLLRREIAEAVAPLRTQVLVGGERNLNYGHVCGTCRFGDDPNESVLDRDNRSHDLPNLFVVDSSFFPSSSGTNPSLTISANALRVADAIDKQLNADPSPRRE